MRWMHFGSPPNNMNALYKLINYRGVQNHNKRSRLGSSAILSVLILFFMIIKVQAAVCYADPKQAYEYLLAQENYETQAREQAVVDINSASEGELVTLDGIGSSKAQAIILYREMFGPFTSVDELEKVKGIGAKTIANNRARMRVQH